MKPTAKYLTRIALWSQEIPKNLKKDIESFKIFQAFHRRHHNILKIEKDKAHISYVIQVVNSIYV